MAAFLDIALFNPTLGGTTDWVVSSAVQGYLTPAGAGAVNGKKYKYRAESADLSEWEVGEGTYTSGTTTLSRDTVLYNSAGTTAKVAFSNPPQVGIVALKDDILSPDENNSFSPGQLAQLLDNLGGGTFGKSMFAAAAAANAWTLLDASAPASAAFRRGNIVGTVSQSGGVPTGALIEYGTNSAGAYVRFADGMQVCWYQATVTNQAISSANGSYLFFGDRSIALPATFSATPSISVGTFNRASGRGWGDCVSAGTSSAVLSGNSPISSASGVNVDIAYIAVGRWF